MGTRDRTKLLFRIGLLLAILLLGGLVFSGCAGARTGAVPRGWSGGTIADGTLFVGSMEGKLVAANISDGSHRWPPVTLESPESPGGGLLGGCAPASTAVAIYGSPAVAGDSVYVGGYNGIIYAFDFGRDEPRWVYPRQGNIGGPIVGGLVVAQGKVYFGSSDGNVYALDAADGYKEWVFQTGDKIWSTPAIDGDTLYIGSFDNKLYALSATDGSKKWEFETEGAIAATPLVYNNTVYMGSFDRHLYAVDATDGSLKWKFMAENWFWARPVIYNDIIYAGCLGRDKWLVRENEGKVYALDVESGDKVGELDYFVDLGSPISSSPVLVDGLLIVASEEGVVYAWDTGTNEQKWKNVDLKEEGQKIYAPLCTGEGVVYIHTSKGKLYALNAQSGAIRWSISLKGQ